MPANLENSAVATGLENVRFHSSPKECSNCHTIALISHASKVVLKILQARLQQYMNHELPDVQAGFVKGRGARDQIANICWIIEKARDQEKRLLLLYWLCQSLWLCESQQTGKFFKRWEYQSEVLNRLSRQSGREVRHKPSTKSSGTSSDQILNVSIACHPGSPHSSPYLAYFFSYLLAFHHLHTV